MGWAHALVHAVPPDGNDHDHCSQDYQALAEGGIQPEDAVEARPGTSAQNDRATLIVSRRGDR